MNRADESHVGCYLDGKGHRTLVNSGFSEPFGRWKTGDPILSLHIADRHYNISGRKVPAENIGGRAGENDGRILVQCFAVGVWRH